MLHSSFLTRITFAILYTLGNCKPIIGLKFLMSGQKPPIFCSEESITVNLVKETF